MNIELPLSLMMQQKLNQFAAITGKSVDELILQAVEDKLAEAFIDDTQPPNAAATNWIEELRSWSNGHPVSTHFVDDSRDSIYEGRRS